MLKVFLASFGHFFTRNIGCKWFHARAEQGLAAKNVRICLTMGKHHHVVVVNAIILTAMCILGAVNQLPMASQFFKRKQVAVELLDLRLTVCLINKLSSKLCDNLVCVFIAQNDIDCFKANGAGSALTSNQKLE
jgi:hypothetical protein